jgi:hypothetical protein
MGGSGLIASLRSRANTVSPRCTGRARARWSARRSQLLAACMHARTPHL